MTCMRIVMSRLRLASLFWLVLGAGSFEIQAQEAPPPKPAAVVADPLARDLLATNPTTPTDILRVLDVLIELRQAKAGEPLLKQLVDIQLDDAKLAALYGEFGAAFFLKLT